MAGKVRTDAVTVPGTIVRDLLARTCSLTGKYGECCQRYDQHTGEVQLCQYWYGLLVHDGRRYLGEARSGYEASRWMAAGELYEPRRYEVLCLEAPSGAPPGATRPR